MVLTFASHKHFFLTEIRISPKRKNKDICVQGMYPDFRRSIGCSIKGVQDDLRVSFFLVTLQIWHIFPVSLSFTTARHHHLGSISLCMLERSFAQDILPARSLYWHGKAASSLWPWWYALKALCGNKLDAGSRNFLRVASFRDDGRSYRSKMRRISSLSPYFSKMGHVWWSSQCEELLIHWGLYRDCTSAVPSIQYFFFIQYNTIFILPHTTITDGKKMMKIDERK